MIALMDAPWSDGGKRISRDERPVPARKFGIPIRVIRETRGVSVIRGRSRHELQRSTTPRHSD